MEYSYTKNPKIGEKTNLTITVKDKKCWQSNPHAFVTLAVDDTPSSLRDNIASTAFKLRSSVFSNQGTMEDKTTQNMYTDSNGHATFTVQLGPKSDTGIYDTEINSSNSLVSLY